MTRVAGRLWGNPERRWDCTPVGEDGFVGHGTASLVVSLKEMNWHWRRMRGAVRVCKQSRRD